VADMTIEPVKEEEIARAKESLTNQFIFNYDSAAKIVKQYALLDYYGYPPDYLEAYLDRLNAVSRQDILNAAKKHMHPEGMVVLAVGTPDSSELSEFGAVKELDIDGN